MVIKNHVQQMVNDHHSHIMKNSAQKPFYI